ncbi:hypothetical protein R6Q59_015812 [Mikania micrantha]
MIVFKPSKDLAKRIQQEWRILEGGLPDMIFVRVYEGRMDLLRAVIIGAEGTPYCDGLFFFDLCFPENYPNDPPQVHYGSGGLRINPNLYKNGRVCLSLLNTWWGTKDEKWRPAVSTMLQVLVSIQAMVFNAKPYFNEPGYEASRGSVVGERYSLQYNHQTLFYSLKTMVYNMCKPPKHFEDLVIGHFHDRASDILTSCEAYYTKGVVVKYGVDAGEEAGRFVNSRTRVEGFMTKLVGAFKQIGVEGLEDYVLPIEIVPTEKKNLIQKILACLGI